jgi:hypothetical protein
MAKSNGNRGSVPVIEPFEGTKDEVDQPAIVPEVKPIEKPDVPLVIDPPAEMKPPRPESDAPFLLVELPDVEPHQGYMTDHLDIRMTPRQRLALARLTKGLDRENARIEGDKHVGKSYNRAMLWLLDQLAAAYDPQAAVEVAT